MNPRSIAIAFVAFVSLMSWGSDAAGQRRVARLAIGGGELAAESGRGSWQGFRSDLSPEQRAAVGSDVTPEDYARARAALTEYESTYGRLPALRTDVPTRYPFYPQAGLHERDLFFNNFFDLDPGGGDAAILDWNCTGYTYDTHDGHDSNPRSFAFQDIGVPLNIRHIYAALPDGRDLFFNNFFDLDPGGGDAAILDWNCTGYTYDTHDGHDSNPRSFALIDAEDGNPDRSTTLTAKPANFVMIDHGGGQTGLYVHMRKKNSVAVSKGDMVVAGQTIGMTASSGFTDGPHLHFETWVDEVSVEPFSGKCNPGSSGFTKQLKFKRKTYLYDAGITHEDLSKLPDKKLPPEQLPSSGQFQTDDEFLNLWFDVRNLPADSTMKLVFRRPNGSVGFDTGIFAVGNTEFFRGSYWFQRWLTGDMRTITGTWKVELHINGKKLDTLPFEVLVKRDPKLNRAPVALKKVKFRKTPKAGTVPFCEIKHPLIVDDPDYDVVSYRYEWTVNGDVVRDVTIAAHSDALATDLFAKGDRLECTVTPTDGDLEAASKAVGSNVK